MATSTKNTANGASVLDAKVTDLIADDKNFNKGSEFGAGLIEKSFQKFGPGRSILLDKNGKIIAGNKSTETYVAGGGTDVIIVESDGTKLIAVKRTDIDLDTEQGREMALADNATAKANIIFDVELIEAELGDAVCIEWGVNPSRKFDAEEFSGQIPTEPITNSGDLYQIGPHRLLCADAILRESYDKLFGEHRADLVVTDPPYNVSLGTDSLQQAVARKRRTDRKVIQNDAMSDEGFYNFLFAFFTNMGDFAKAGGAWYVWHPNIEVVNFSLAMKNAGITPRQALVWDKGTMVLGRQDYQIAHEPCIYGWKDGAAHNWYADRSQKTIIDFHRPFASDLHPTMKPVPLIAYQIENSSKAGDLVADPFGGSGTTMVAAEELRRTCFMLDKDESYCDVVVARMALLNNELEIRRNGVLLSQQDLLEFTNNVYG